DLGGIPGGHDQPARIRIAPDFIDDIGDLIDAAAIGGRPRAPLMPIDPSGIAVGVGPFIPNAHAMLGEVFDIGIAAQEPEQLVDDRFDVQLLCGQQWKAALKVEPHLMPEDRARADAGAIAFFDALAEHTLHQVEILAHLALRSGRFDLRSLASNERPTKPAQGDYGIPVWSRWSPRRRGPARVQKCLDSRLRRNERNCAVARSA